MSSSAGVGIFQPARRLQSAPSASTSALLPAVASPKICGWRRSSLSLMAEDIVKLKRPSSLRHLRRESPNSRSPSSPRRPSKSSREMASSTSVGLSRCMAIVAKVPL